MQLNYKREGTSGQPLIILHGLFGSLDNWQTLAKRYSEYFQVYLVDQRNHGHSPHSDEWNYAVMADDINHFCKEHQLVKPIILGHSMGGKTAMQVALSYPDLLEKMIVADISPRYYAPHHQSVIAAISDVDLNLVSSRKEVEAILEKHHLDLGTRQFLLKNLYWADNENTRLAWRFNIKVIKDKINEIGSEIILNRSLNIPALFIRGERSPYISDQDVDDISSKFINVTFKTIAGAGHWLHAEKPQEFFTETIGWLNN